MSGRSPLTPLRAFLTRVSWLAANPIVSSVFTGATKSEQVEQNFKAVGWALSAEELAEIDKLTGKGI